MRILASVVAVVAFSAITAAQAAASPEFDAEKYPVKVEGVQLNFQGFGDPLKAIAANCEVATASTEEEGIANPTKNSPTLTVHPIYGVAGPPSKCILTLLSSTSGESHVLTEGCQYVFHAAPGPGKPEALVDIKCGKQETVPKPGGCKVFKTAGEACEIRIEATFLPGCVVSVPAQTSLGKIEYKNEPAGEVKLAAEVSKIKTKIASACGVGKTETESEYREGEVSAGNAKLAPAGKPALFQAKGKEPGGVTAIPIEVGVNEAHWYENHVADAPQSGTGAELGESTISWGTLVLEKGNQSGTECRSEWGGHVYNTGAAGNFNGTVAPGAGNSAAGEVKVNALQAYDCTLGVGSACTAGSALSVEPEGLGWGGKLSGGGVSATTVKLGTGGTFKVRLKCTGYDATWTGELAPTLANGTEIGKAPSSLTFGGVANELTVAGTGVTETKGIINNKVKLMGYEGGELVTSKNP